jgi:hypothetical protein
MDQFVSFQITRTCESLAANITQMFLLACMDQLVSLQVASLIKSLVANITYKIFCFCMDSQLVSFQGTSMIKVLVANITHMFVAGRCSTLMTVGWAWLGSRVCLAKKYW